MEQDPIVPVEVAAPEGVAPAAEAPQTPDYRETFFGTAEKELGRKFTDENELFSHVKSLQGEATDYKGKYEEVESRVKSIPPALIEVSEMLRADGFQGTERELLRKSVDYLSKHSVDYAEEAINNPAQVLKQGHKNANPAYTDSQLDMLVARKERAYRAEAEQEGLDEEATNQYVKDALSLEATQFVPALEATKAALRFKPESAPAQRTEADIQAEQQAIQRANVDGTWAAIKSFKALDLGDAGEWEVSLLDDKGGIKPEYLPELNKVADPNAWFSQFLNADGTPNHAAMLKVSLTMMEAPKAAARKAQDAHGEGARGLALTLKNPKVPGITSEQSPGGNGKLTAEEWAKLPPVRA